VSVHGHWLRGAFGGLALGLALGIMLTLYGVVRLGDLTPLWILLASVAFGVGWSFVSPAPRAGRGAAQLSETDD